jgi:hypothetical protein
MQSSENSKFNSQTRELLYLFAILECPKFNPGRGALGISPRKFTDPVKRKLEI